MAKKEKQTGASLTTSEGSRGGLMRPERDFFGTSLSPFSVMRRLMSDMDRFFEDVGFGGALLPQHMALPERRGAAFEFTWWPQVDVSQSEGKLFVRADLPGVKKDDLHISVEEGNLVLEGERKMDREVSEGGIYRAERSYGKFRRVILLPQGADFDSAKANFTDGVLEVSIEVPQRTTRGRRIEIGAGPIEAGREQRAEEQKGAEEEKRVH